MFSAGTGTLHVEVMQNHNVIGENYGTTDASSATINVVVKCQQGDVVFARHMTGQPHQTIYGAGYSAFSGFMIG